MDVSFLTAMEIVKITRQTSRAPGKFG